MEILWWLAPAGIVTVLAMAWVSWLARDGRGGVDREVAVARLAKALENEPRVTARPRPRVPDRSTGIAVRPSRGTAATQTSAQTSAPSSTPISTPGSTQSPTQSPTRAPGPRA